MKLNYLDMCPWPTNLLSWQREVTWFLVLQADGAIANTSAHPHAGGAHQLTRVARRQKRGVIPRYHERVRRACDCPFRISHDIPGQNRVR